MMVLLFFAAMYIIIYPQIQSLQQGSQTQQEEQTIVSEFSSVEDDEQSEDVTTDADENDAAAQAIAAIEEKEKEAADSEEVDEEAVDSSAEEVSESEVEETSTTQVYYKFRNNQKFQDHFKKHGGEMGFSTAEEYLDAANALINNPDALQKLEKEDNDKIYYLESTNEIAFVSQDGYLRTYFICSGRDYYDRQ